MDLNLGYPNNETDNMPEDWEHQKKLEESVLATLRPFESVPMIIIDMLVEAWPGEYKLNEPNVSKLSTETKEESSATSVHPTPDTPFVGGPRVCPCSQSCTSNWRNGRPESGNVSKIKETLRTHDPLSEFAFTLLSKVIPIEAKQNKSIDLSHFSLTGEHVVQLLSAQESVEVLNLCDMQHIATGILREFIPILPNL